jgi:hypothetical protein
LARSLGEQGAAGRTALEWMTGKIDALPLWNTGCASGAWKLSWRRSCGWRGWNQQSPVDRHGHGTFEECPERAAPCGCDDVGQCLEGACEACRNVRRPTPAQQAEAARIARELAEAGFALPGTLTERLTRCGRPSCRCHADPPVLHGPYHQWTRKVAGKTVTRLLTDDQLADYQPGLDSQRRLRALWPGQAQT